MATAVALNTKAQATRARILEAAAGLFWRRSYHGVAIDEVAARSGVNKATIYRYYLDKAELALAAVVHNGETVIREIFEPAVAMDAAGDERLASIYGGLFCIQRRYIEAEGDIYGCPIAGLALELGQDIPEVRHEAQQIFARIEHFMEKISACPGRPRNENLLEATALAPALVQLLHGAFTSARLAVDAAPVLEAGNASLALWGSEIRLYPEMIEDLQ